MIRSSPSLKNIIVLQNFLEQVGLIRHGNSAKGLISGWRGSEDERVTGAIGTGGTQLMGGR